MKNPSCLYIDANEVLYICDYDNNRIQKWIQCTGTGITIAGSSSGTSGSTSSLLNSPADLTFDKNGFMYVADRDNHRVQRFPPGSTVGTTVAGNTTKANASATLDHLMAVDVDEDLNIYILDVHNFRVIKWAPNATSGVNLINDTDLDGAYDLILVPGSPNQVYISDPVNNKIYLWTFGTSTPAVTLAAVATGVATLSQPKGIVLDPYGNLYVADYGNNRVVMYCAGSTVGTVIAQSTTPAIDQPTAVALDSKLNLYVAIANGDKILGFPRR